MPPLVGILLSALIPQIKGQVSELVDQGLNLLDRAVKGEVTKKVIFEWLDKYADDLE